ncbi:hypothetical protein PAE975_6053 (plasmid) [Pseudomonas aeruginosa]|nr:hypothetical protein [Pseudomonas aeruginosa]HEK3608676.1 hypothetical protein [Pseudomonas aeruginosa]
MTSNTIFRAMVSASPDGPLYRAKPLRVAFIEATDRADALARLPTLAATLWGVPVETVDVCHLASEHELALNPGVQDIHVSQILFAIGVPGESPIFINGQGHYGHPLFFLEDELDRVMDVYLQLPRG